MDRHEAILRELNIYPLWVRREQSAQVMTEQSNTVRPEPDRTTSHSTKPASGQVAGYVEGQELAPTVSIQTSSVNSTHSSQGSGLPAFSTSSVRTETNKPAATFSELNPVNLNWPELKSAVHSCQACALRAGCTQPVFGTGDESANWLFVGDAPDADDDAQGEPFAGQAGKLLDNMLMAIKLKRHNVYLTHAIKCRPVDDRHPHVGEIAQCLPYLQRQIALIQPKVIVALGKVASQALLGNDATLASLRGAPHSYQGIPLIVTYYPTYLLRSPMEKAKAWQDLCLAVAMLQKQS